MDVLVGEDEVKFVLHQAIVCTTSLFFRAICNGKWKESEERLLRLPEVDPEMFSIYLGFLYNRKVDMREERSADMKSLKTVTGEALIHLHDRAIHAYALGEMVQDAAFRNAVVDEMRFVWTQPGQVGHQRSIQTLCATVSHRSKLMRYFVDRWAVADYSDCSFRDFYKHLPTNFVLELACVHTEERDMHVADRRVSARDRCFYHDHESEADKCK